MELHMAKSGNNGYFQSFYFEAFHIIEIETEFETIYRVLRKLPPP